MEFSYSSVLIVNISRTNIEFQNATLTISPNLFSPVLPFSVNGTVTHSLHEGRKLGIIFVSILFLMLTTGHQEILRAEL